MRCNEATHIDRVCARRSRLKTKLGPFFLFTDTLFEHFGHKLTDRDQNRKNMMLSSIVLVDIHADDLMAYPGLQLRELLKNIDLDKLALLLTLSSASATGLVSNAFCPSHLDPTRG
jgi:hypothetical protein